jgi:hypothetical protein
VYATPLSVALWMYRLVSLTPGALTVRVCPFSSVIVAFGNSGAPIV